MSSPKVSYIVSAYDRPQALRCCLASLQCQSDPDFEVIIADNATTEQLHQEHWEMMYRMYDPRFRHLDTAKVATSPAWDCYWSAEAVVEHEAKGEWIVLPSDDSYYTPVFQATMLKAAEANNWDLAYCDMLYDRRGHGKYHHKTVAARSCEIDKTCFMLKREKWIGFPTKPTEALAASCCDGEMIEELVRRGVRHGRVDELLCVHN